jgi:hypothetical protein
MPSVICTLFEGNYHKGVAGLVNSLYYFDFRGDVFIGYRGALPPWADDAENNSSLNWSNAKILKAADGLNLYFLPVDTHFHLSNYKPTFMLSLFEKLEDKIEGLVYFDPDIILKCHWDLYEKWMKRGISLVHEITSNDMPATHPVRLEWEDIVNKSGRKITHSISSYINAGFCAVSIENIEFLKIWKEIIEIGSNEYGMNVSKIAHLESRSNPFYANDQDALNIAAMCCNSPISEMGPEGMGFIHGGHIMSHAVGSPKPWNKRFIHSALKGYPPGTADKDFWMHAKFPIKIHSDQEIKLKRLAISAAAFMSRFYKRN